MYEQRRLCRSLPRMRERAIRSNTIHYKFVAGRDLVGEIGGYLGENS